MLFLLAAAPAWAAERPPDPRVALTLLLLLPVALCSFTALELVLWVLAPAPLSATCRAIQRGRGWCLLAGLLAAAVVLVLISVLGKTGGAGGRLATLILGVALLGALIGLTAVTALLGEGALVLAGRAGSRAVAVVAGSLLLGFTCLIPVVGWALGVYFILIGLGGVLRAIARPK